MSNNDNNDVNETVDSNRPVLPPPPALPANLRHISPKRHKSSDNFSPIRLHFAINKEEVDEVQHIVANSGSRELNFIVRGNTPLIQALLIENEAIELILLEALASEDILIAENARWRRQPIHIAIKTGQFLAVEKMVQKCPRSVNATDALLFTPLHWAAIYNRFETASLLIEAGAHIDIRDDQGRTPLHRAVQYDSSNMVKLLLEHGALTDVVDHFGWTAVFHCITCGMLDTLQCLLQHGASVHTRDFQAQTPLHYAAHRLAPSHLDTVSRCSADYNMRQMRTSGPAVHSALHKHHTVDLKQIRVLLDFGADVNVLDGLGQTPFKISVTAGHFDIARLLYTAGADLNLESSWISTGDWPAAVVESETFSDWLLERFTCRVRTLSDLCKFVIRRSLGREIDSKVGGLRLPDRLVRYCSLDV